MHDTAQLVEHYFRHQYGRLVGLLTSRLGAGNLQLAEDAVQTALQRALANWPRSGIPDKPSAWLYRSALNAATDALRHRTLASRKLAELNVDVEYASNTSNVDSEVGDETLRLLFLCCHPTVSAESRIALALRIIGGFSTAEIACGLLTSNANIEKRITRAKEKLREQAAEIIELNDFAVTERLESVLSTIYLIFNEGYAASNGESTIKQDLCDEAIRLCRMLVNHPNCSLPNTMALLALLLLHSARLDERMDASGCANLLANQDRAQWNWSRVREAMEWMQRSAHGAQLSRYHIEAAIVWEHSRAPRFADTSWNKIFELYHMLNARFPSPAIELNMAIAASYAIDVSCGLKQLLNISVEHRRVLRPWWDCAMAQLLERDQQLQAAQSHWRDAVALAVNEAQKAMIQKRLER